MKVIRSMIMALSMYTKLPMPKVDWKKENMKYTMCFFPLAGVLVAIGVYFVGIWCEWMGFHLAFRGIAMTIAPIIITGGIHLDGYMDTLDGLGSYGEIEKKLEIMKDPNTGAFAVIGFGVYILGMAGCFMELPLRHFGLLFLVFVLSRILSGLSVATFPLSKTSGLLYMFAKSAHKKQVAIILGVEGILLGTLFIGLYGLVAVYLIVIGGVVFAYYWWMSKKHFGGITGDVAGYFLQVCEGILLLGLIIGDKLWF